MPAFLVLLAIVALLVLTCGCTRQASPAQQSTATVQQTPAAAGTSLAAAPAQEDKTMVTFTDKDNGTTADVTANTKFAVQLKENPTTGYAWNASTGSGLTILSSDYQEDKHAEGMVGVGGTHTWILQATGSGDQMFTAVYRRPWEAVTGNESAYTLTVHIVPS
jgi:predicted secreted protein